MSTERRGPLAAIGLGFLLLGLALGALVLTVLSPGSVLIPLVGLGVILGACLLLWALDAWAASVVTALRKQRETAERAVEGMRSLELGTAERRNTSCGLCGEQKAGVFCASCGALQEGVDPSWSSGVAVLIVRHRISFFAATLSVAVLGFASLIYQATREHWAEKDRSDREAEATKEFTAREDAERLRQSARELMVTVADVRGRLLAFGSGCAAHSFAAADPSAGESSVDVEPVRAAFLRCNDEYKTIVEAYARYSWVVPRFVGDTLEEQEKCGGKREQSVTKTACAMMECPHPGTDAFREFIRSYAAYEKSGTRGARATLSAAAKKIDGMLANHGCALLAAGA